jgi:hypothetical protein
MRIAGMLHMTVAMQLTLSRTHMRGSSYEMNDFPSAKTFLYENQQAGRTQSLIGST